MTPRRLAPLVAIVVFALAAQLAWQATPALAVCNSTIAYGNVFDCTLSVSTEVDSYTFSGTSGEKVLFRMTSGSVYGVIKVKRPNATQLCTKSEGTDVQLECTLDATGTFTIEASGWYGSGSYFMHIARMSAPTTETPTAIAYGAVVTATWPQVRWVGYSFSGANGEKVLIRIKKTSGPLGSALQFNLRRSDGVDVCSNTTAIDQVQQECVLNLAGTTTYTLWTRTVQGITAQDYILYVARTSAPTTETATAISYGGVLTGTVAAMKWYPYTFTGAVGERIVARVVQPGAGIAPELKIRRPDGTQLCSATTIYEATAVCVLDAAGAWTVWASAQNGASSGAYSIYVTRLNPSPTEIVTPISYGDVMSAPGAAMKWYPFTFSGTAGERALVHLRPTTGGTQAAFALQAPSGNVTGPFTGGASLCNSYVGAYDARGECALNETGTWTVWVYYYIFSGTSGNMSVHVARMTAPTSEPTVLLEAGHARANTTTPMRVYPYSFTGAQNEVVRLRFTSSGTSHGIGFSVRRPDFSTLCSGAGTQDVECTLNLAGTNTYTIWVSAAWGDEVGPYTLTFIRKPVLGSGYAKNPVADPRFPSFDIADPVDLGSGNYLYHATDVAIPSLGGGLAFTRSYNAGIPTTRFMGKGWTHNWDMYLAIGAGEVDAYYPGGNAVPFLLYGGMYQAPTGVEDTLTLNGDGTYTLRTKSFQAFFFSAAGKLTGMADRNGNTTTVAYNGSGYLASVIVPGGRQLTFTTDGSGRVTGITDPLGRTVSYSYTGAELTSMTDIGGGVWNYAYGASGMTSMTDPLGHTTITNLFDSAGRVREQLDAGGNRWCIHFGTTPSYTSAGCPAVSPAPNASQVVVVNARGFKTTYEIDFKYRTSKVTDAVGGVTQTTYDNENYPVLLRDPLNHDITSTYDANGNVLTRKNHLNNTWTYTYNAFNDVLTETDPLSHVRTNAYDLAGRLTSTQDALGNTIAYTVTIEGLVTAVTDPRTNVTAYGYDAHGNRLTTTNALGKVWTSTVDLGGRVLTATDPLAHVTTNTYNNRNQVLTSTNHLAQATTYTYDAKGNKKTLTDANAKGMTWNYDALDRVSSVVDPASQTTSYVYDAKGNQTSVTNVRGKVTTSAYDALNRRTSVTDPLSRTTSYTYDAASRMTQRTDARGLKAKYLYDNADRNTSVEYRTAADVLVSTLTYAYDTANRRTSVADLVGTTTYGYDNADRLTSATFPGSPTKTVSYMYDAAGNRTKVTYPDTKFVDYSYDAANRMATVVDRTTATPFTTSYAYDDAGRLTSTTYPNGVVGTNGYDAADRLTSVTNAKAGTFSSFGYTLDAVGNRTQAVVTGGGAGTHSYTLDNLYRLTSVTYPGAVTDTYTYDQLGNRLAKNATSYTYDNADELTAAGGTAYTYDLNGNQLTRGADTFTWDHENRLTQSTVGGVTSSSVYYGNGVRRSHTVNGVTTTYTYDVASSLPVVLQDGTNSLVYGLDLISSTDGAGNRTYFSYDGLGSTSDLTDAAGNVTDTYSYDVFGAVRARTGTNASPWKFTGEQEDGAAGDSGYYFLRARYYDPSTGRFASKDPIEFDQRYAYAGNNSVRYADPSGLMTTAESLMIVGELLASETPLLGSEIESREGVFFISGPLNGRINRIFDKEGRNTDWLDPYGIDIGGAPGAAVHSPRMGTVVFAGLDTGSNSCKTEVGCSSLVIVQTLGSTQIGIRHMRGIAVAQGDMVRAGDVLGYQSNVGTYDDHVHFEAAHRTLKPYSGLFDPLLGLAGRPMP